MFFLFWFVFVSHPGNHILKRIEYSEKLTTWIDLLLLCGVSSPQQIGGEKENSLVDPSRLGSDFLCLRGLYFAIVGIEVAFVEW